MEEHKPGQGGRTANMNGKLFEALLASELTDKGFNVETQIINGTNLYGRKMRADLLIDEWLAVEAKYQAHGGSVDEKYPFLVESVKQNAKYPTVIVYGGEGARPSAIEWLKSQVDGERLLGVFTQEEFYTWLSTV